MVQGPRACPVAEPPAAGEEEEEEEEGRSRLSLLSSLLRAIEESHGGSLSHLEEQPQPAPCTPSPPASGESPTLFFHQLQLSAGFRLGQARCWLARG